MTERAQCEQTVLALAWVLAGIDCDELTPDYFSNPVDRRMFTEIQRHRDIEAAVGALERSANGETDYRRRVGELVSCATTGRDSPDDVVGTLLSLGPAVGRFEATTIPADFMQKKRLARALLYQKLYIRGLITAIGGAGGVGKSIVAMLTMVSMAAGRDLLLPDQPAIKRRRVLIINNEDDDAEIELRLAAIFKHHNIDPAELTGWLFYRSGYHEQLRLAAKTGDKWSAVISATPVLMQIERFVKEHQIDAVVADPLVSLHNAAENTNDEMDAVMALIKQMAARCRCSFTLIHHTSKNKETANVDDGMRGATAVVNAARVVNVFTKMTARQARESGVADAERRFYIQRHRGKENLSLSSVDGEWFYLKGVPLDVVDEDGAPATEFVGVPIPVTVSPVDGDNAEEKQWTPTAVAEALEPYMKGIAQVSVSDFASQAENIFSVRNRRARQILNMLPLNKRHATKVRFQGNYVTYWREKGDGVRGSIVIFREEL